MVVQPSGHTPLLSCGQLCLARKFTRFWINTPSPLLEVAIQWHMDDTCSNTLKAFVFGLISCDRRHVFGQEIFLFLPRPQFSKLNARKKKAVAQVFA